MRAVRILLVVAAAVIVIAVAAVTIVPGELDWNRYRGVLEVLASEALARPVTIAGPVSLSVLPAPVLTASRVSVESGGGVAEIHVEKLRLRVALVPLLMGEVEARSLTLLRPNLRLGWPPWRDLPSVVPPWLTAVSAHIEDGRIAAGALVLTHVDATVTAGRGTTALTLAGSAALGTSTWQLELRVGEPTADGTSPLVASLKGGGAAAGTEAKLASRRAPGGGFSGHLTLDGPHLSELLPAPALPFHADGTFSLAGGGLALKAVSVTVGSVTATGDGHLMLQPASRLDLALTSRDTVPLDPWVTVLSRDGRSRLPVGLTLTAPRATLARGLVRQLELAVVLGTKGAQLGVFRGILPGNATLAAEGRIVRAADKTGSWQFVGTAHLAAAALLGTVHWLDAARPGLLPPLPAAVLGPASIGGRVAVGPGGIALDDLAGKVDGSRVKGSLTLGVGGHPAISAGLALDRLNLDPWLPARLHGAAAHQGFPLAMVPRMFAGISVELRLTADQATIGRMAVSGLSLDAAAEAGQVILRRLDATVAGVHAIASGTIGAGGVVTAGRLALTAAGPAGLAGGLPAPFGPAIGRWKAPLALDATAAGPPERLDLTVNATLGDLRVTTAPVLDVGTGVWHGPVTVRYPGAAEFIAAAGLPNPVAWLGQGSLSLIGEMNEGPRGWSLKEFRLIAGALHATGSLEGANGPDGPEISGTVQATTLPVPPLRVDAGSLVPGLLGGPPLRIGFSAGQVTAGLRVLLKGAEGSLDTAGGKGVLEVEGNLPGGGGLTAVLRMTADGGPPRITLGAALAGVHVKGGLLAGVPDLETGTLAGRAALTAEGYGPAALIATLSGSISLRVRNGVISGVNLGGVRAALAAGGSETEVSASLTKALGGGESRFDRLAMVAHGDAGRFALAHLEMESGEGAITAQGTVDLPTRTEDVRLNLRPALAGAPSVVLRFSGPVAKPERLAGTGVALQWAAGRAGRR